MNGDNHASPPVIASPGRLHDDLRELLFIENESAVTFGHWDGLYLAASSISGVGLFTGHDVMEGGRILTVEGELVRLTYGVDGREADPNYPNAIGIAKEKWLSPALDNPMNFINHCCEPNVIVGEALRLTALTAIEAHTELLLDYSTTELDPGWSLACACGAKSCRRELRAFQFLPKELQAKYAKHVPQRMLADLLEMTREVK